MIKQKGLVIHPEEMSNYWAERFFSTNLNLLGLHPAGGITGGKTVDEAIEWLKAPESDRLLKIFADRGIDIEYEMHALSWLLPRDMFSGQPEWFRMDENQNRTNDYHFCHSNPQALEFISERAKKAAEIFSPTTKRHHFWLDDTADCSCHCPKCEEQKKEGFTASDVAMTVYNAIMDGIRAHDPKAKQCYLAYSSVYAAPKKVLPKPGIFLEYAPMARELDRSLCDPESEKNQKTAGYIDELLKTFSTEDAKVLDYWLDNSWNSGWKKPVKKLKYYPKVQKADIEFYSKKGFETITTFACSLGEEYYELYGEHADIGSYAALFE